MPSRAYLLTSLMSPAFSHFPALPLRFERLDTKLQKFDQKLGSPSKQWDGVTGFLASEISRAANGTSQALTDGAAPIGNFFQNASTAVGDWSSNAVTAVDSTIKLSEGIKTIGSSISSLKSEWFEKEEEVVDVQSNVQQAVEALRLQAAGGLPTTAPPSGSVKPTAAAGGSKESTAAPWADSAAAAAAGLVDSVGRSYDLAAGDLTRRFGGGATPAPDGGAGSPGGGDGSTGGNNMALFSVLNAQRPFI